MTREEAIKVVRNIYQTDAEKEALETLIPELKESEDERIRKAICACIIDINNDWITLHGASKEEALAWLEKQKEQKPAEKVESKIMTREMIEGRLLQNDIESWND